MLADRLHELLADTYVLFAKTQNYHWNVEGCNFKSLHEMFEEQYSDLYSAIDVLAEIIRTLGVNTNGTLSEYLRLSKIEEPELGVSSCKMVEDLLRDNMLIQETLNAVLDEAKNEDDEVVAAFVSDRLTAHRKAAWMLKSTICGCCE